MTKSDELHRDRVDATDANGLHDVCKRAVSEVARLEERVAELGAVVGGFPKIVSRTRRSAVEDCIGALNETAPLDGDTYGAHAMHAACLAAVTALLPEKPSVERDPREARESGALAVLLEILPDVTLAGDPNHVIVGVNREVLDRVRALRKGGPS